MIKLPDKELLRVEEVANYFSVTNRTIYLWIEHGHLEAERTVMGRSIRITRESALKCRLCIVKD
jgi:excisionase family DNA binding protein